MQNDHADKNLIECNSSTQIYLLVEELRAGLKKKNKKKK